MSAQITHGSTEHGGHFVAISSTQSPEELLREAASRESSILPPTDGLSSAAESATFGERISHALQSLFAFIKSHILCCCFSQE